MNSLQQALTQYTRERILPMDTRSRLTLTLHPDEKLVLGDIEIVLLDKVKNKEGDVRRARQTTMRITCPREVKIKREKREEHE